MKTIFLSIFLSFILGLPGKLIAQEFSLLAKLPALVNESSGIVAAGPNTFWTFNDSGGETDLYLFNSVGKHLKTLKITNSRNRDWEDICQDDKGNLYIANTGNNYNNNTDLSVFKIPNPAGIRADSIEAEEISYHYEDQYSFPPPKDSMNFDCEAILWNDGNLYLFTKHRTLPMATNLYRIPAKEGRHVAKKIASFKTGMAGPGEKQVWDYWITSADISPDGKSVCLLSHNKVWLFYGFEEDRFFEGNLRQINLGNSTQKEAVCFINNNDLFITDENEILNSSGGNLYRLRIQ